MLKDVKKELFKIIIFCMICLILRTGSCLLGITNQEVVTIILVAGYQGFKMGGVVNVITNRT